MDEIKKWIQDNNIDIKDSRNGDVFYLKRFDIVLVHQVSGFRVIKCSTNETIGYVRG